MLTPERRLRDLEMQFQAVRRELHGVASRPAGPLNLRQGWWLGELAEDLDEGSTALVNILRWDGSAWTSAVTQVTARSFFPGDLTQGTRVYVRWYYNTFVAIATSDNETSDRIWVEFTLTEDMDETTVFQASATVTDAIGTDPPAISASITVVDDRAIFGDCIEGAKGLAINWGTSASPEYRIVYLERVAEWAEATLESQVSVMWPDDDPDVNEATVSFLLVGNNGDPPPFADCKFTNPYRLRAEASSKLLMHRRYGTKDADGKWVFEVIRVEPPKTTRLGVLTGTLSAGGTASAREITHDGAAFVLGELFTVHDFFMNVGETVDADTKLIAHLIDKVWVPITYCEVSDTIPDSQSQQVLQQADEQNQLAATMLGGEPAPTFDVSLTN